jgi:hypothetical protein
MSKDLVATNYLGLSNHTMNRIDMADANFTLTKDLLHELFEYKNGDLYWKVKRSTNVKPGDKAGTINSGGYIHTHINNKPYKNHRLIFMMFYGYMPPMIDHIDGNKSNNKIENLRGATHLQNMWNQKVSKKSTSGIKGVYWHKIKQKWQASCGKDSKLVHLGYFDKKEDAEKMVKEFREKNHGEFANWQTISKVGAEL